MNEPVTLRWAHIDSVHKGFIGQDWVCLVCNDDANKQWELTTYKCKYLVGSPNEGIALAELLVLMGELKGYTK